MYVYVGLLKILMILTFISVSKIEVRDGIKIRSVNAPVFFDMR